MQEMRYYLLIVYCVVKIYIYYSLMLQFLRKEKRQEQEEQENHQRVTHKKEKDKGPEVNNKFTII